MNKSESVSPPVAVLAAVLAVLALALALARPAVAQEILVAEATVDVPEWSSNVGTDLYVQSGDRIVIEASGAVKPAGDNIFYPPTGPDGYERANCVPNSSYPHWAPRTGPDADFSPRCFSLIGRIGPWGTTNGDYFFVGSSYDQAYGGANGVLWLRTNDDWPGNGSGSFTANVKVYRNPLPPVSCNQSCQNGRIAFDGHRDGNSDIYRMNADGSGQTRLTNGPVNGQTAGFEPAYSPDGTKIAFASFREDGNREIYVMNADGSGVTRLTSNSAWDGEPVFSRDGTRIAFQRDSEIYVMNAADGNRDGNGDNQVRLTDDPAVDNAPAFSPDGSRIAFVSARHGDSEVFAMNALDGSNPARLTRDIGVSHFSKPTFSPDGARITFGCAWEEGNGEICVMNANGSSPTNLTNNPALDDHPAYSPDGTKIAFVSQRDGNDEIYVMHADGTNQTRLTNNETTDTYPTWGGATDTTPPETTITSGPSGTVNTGSATFEFSSNEAGATFQCKLDGLAFSACSSPKTYSGLANGSHTFKVRTIDVYGNVDASPATRAWTVAVAPPPPPPDTTAPTITKVKPADLTTGVSPTALVTATFSEPINADTLTTKTFKVVRQGTTTKVAATVRYDPATKRAFLDPTQSLVPGATYTATVTTGAKDPAGNGLAANKAWRFTVKP